MFRDLFSGNPANLLAIGGLLFFVLVFLGVLAWIASRRRSAHFAHMAMLPIEDAVASEETP